MRELEKARAGLMYDAYHDTELQALRNQAAEQVYDYNHCRPSDTTRQLKLLHALFASVGENVAITAPFHCEYGFNVHIGHNVHIDTNLTLFDGARIDIGNNVFIASNVGLYASDHPMDAERRNQGMKHASPITIGDNTWIGASTSILPGITIGEGCVIGSGSVVTHDIPPGVVAFGNPCRIVRPVSEQDTPGS